LLDICKPNEQNLLSAKGENGRSSSQVPVQIPGEGGLLGVSQSTGLSLHSFLSAAFSKPWWKNLRDSWVLTTSSHKVYTSLLKPLNWTTKGRKRRSGDHPWGDAQTFFRDRILGLIYCEWLWGLLRLYRLYRLVGGFKHVFFHNILDNPSHWLIFFKMVKTTNQ
jgi:hypothetical protein